MEINGVEPIALYGFYRYHDTTSHAKLLLRLSPLSLYSSLRVIQRTSSELSDLSCCYYNKKLPSNGELFTLEN
jgi:hypothetical protein